MDEKIRNIDKYIEIAKLQIEIRTGAGKEFIKREVIRQDGKKYLNIGAFGDDNKYYNVDISLT